MEGLSGGGESGGVGGCAAGRKNADGAWNHQFLPRGGASGKEPTSPNLGLLPCKMGILLRNEGCLMK